MLEFWHSVEIQEFFRYLFSPINVREQHRRHFGKSKCITPPAQLFRLQFRCAELGGRNKGGVYAQCKQSNRAPFSWAKDQGLGVSKWCALHR